MKTAKKLVWITEKTHTQFKGHCDKQGFKMGATLDKILREYLKKNSGSDTNETSTQ